jgi:hypothetical protein
MFPEQFVERLIVIPHRLGSRGKSFCRATERHCGCLFRAISNLDGPGISRGIREEVQVGWNIIRHWAELALAIAVLPLFQGCQGLQDVLRVISDADDLTRLGIITAVAIASSGFAGMVRAIANGLRLVEMLRLAGLLRLLWQWLLRLRK